MIVQIFTKNRLLPLLTLLALLFAAFLQIHGPRQESPSSSQILEAYTDHRSNIQVEGEGRIIKILKNDLQGARHQKFIVQINSDLAVLISHNIDLAPRLDDIKPGDHISFSGEYIWNEKGGLVHWTHHDPNNSHPDGWLMLEGRTYQ